jgi:hypothetical protein
MSSKKRRRARSDPHSISTFRQRDVWICQMLATDNEVLSIGTKLVMVRIALHLNVKKGQCYPSVSTLAKGTGICERHVPRVLAALERTGWITVTRSPGRSNSFLLKTPPTPDSGVRGADNRTPDSGVTPDSRVRGPLTPESPKQRSNSGCGRGSAPRPADAGAGFGKELVLVGDAVGGFGALQAIWSVKPHPGDEVADRQAFERALRLASEAVILAGASAWADAAVAAGEERYLQPLAKWLGGRCWERPPPKKPKARPRGNGSKAGQDLTKLMLKQEAGYVEDDDGNLRPEGRVVQ